MSDHHGAKGQAEVHVEEGVLYQPLEAAAVRYVFSVLGEIEKGLKAVGSVTSKGVKIIVSGAKYAGKKIADGAKDVYKFLLRHVAGASPQTMACAGSATLFAGAGILATSGVAGC